MAKKAETREEKVVGGEGLMGIFRRWQIQ